MQMPSRKKFEARISTELWDRFEEWADGRGKIDNSQLFTALLRLFLGLPDSYRMMALYGKGVDFSVDQALQQTVQEALAAAEDRRSARALADPIGALRDVLEPLAEAELKHLPPSDARRLHLINSLLGDDREAALADTVVRNALARLAEPGEKESNTRTRKPRAARARGRSAKKR